MRRCLPFMVVVFAACLAFMGAVLVGGKPGPAKAAVRLSGSLAAPNSPSATCNFTPLTFNLNGLGVVGATRPFSATEGDTFAQFIGLPITATSSSTADVIVGNGFAGNISGGITGTFTLTNLNGLIIGNPEGLTTARGLQLHNIVINGASGSITAVMALNFASLTSSPPYYPRVFNGYFHSIATSGSYASYKYTGTIAGTMVSIAGQLTISASAIGRLYTGGGSLTDLVTAVRPVPPNRATFFLPTDYIAQFRTTDFSAGPTVLGHISPRTTFTGTTLGTINGVFVLDHDSLVVDSGTNSGRGWLAGEFSLVDVNADILTGPWVSDIHNNTVSGYVFQVIGTGIYTDSLLFGTVDGTLINSGAGFFGSMTGTYCDGSQIPTPTPSLTPTFGPSPTGTPTRISTATTAPTQTAIATQTPLPTATTAASTTATSMATATVIATATATSGATVTATPTLCPISFTDVQPSDYFYLPVQYLYCHNVISGYGTEFRPYNNTSRGQLCKIVVLGANLPIDTSGGPHFTDVPATNVFYPYVETAFNRGIVNGYGAEFRPNDNVTRGQLCKIIVLARGWDINTVDGPHFTDVPPGSTFYSYVETAFNKGIISGYGSLFKPNDPATRGQISKIVYLAVTQP